MKVTRQGASDSFRVEVRASESAEAATPADIGFGFSQVLPVVVQCAFAEEGGTYLFEQPEIHLHPTAQRRLGLFFADALARRPATYLLETHSLYLVHGLQEAVRTAKLDRDDVLVYAVRSQGGVSSIRSYRIDTEGDLWDEWQEGFVVPWD
jgi:predicted ATPase